MQEFRPADVIDEDTRVAESLIDGNVDALGTLVRRFARAVDAAVASRSDATHSDDSVDVFARAWLEREKIEPGSDFAPWLGRLAADVAGRQPHEVDDAWAVAMAIEAVEPRQRPTLRAHHVAGEDLPADADRHELRLRRRLAHLGDEAAVLTALGDPRPWTEPDVDLMRRVRSRLGLDDGARDDDRHPEAPVDDDPVPADEPSRVARSLRPVLLGLAGAVAVLFVAIIALSAASGSPDPIAFTEELVPTGAILDVEGGELTVIERDAGLRLDLDAPTLPRRAGDQFYEGVLVLSDGTELAVGTFNEGFDVRLSGGVALERVDAFLVVARELGSDVSDVVLKLDVPRS